MRRFMAAAIALSVATQSSAAEVEPADRQQLLQLAQRMDRAWTAGDANANAVLFAADATARFGSEPLGEGRDSIRQQFEGFFKDRPAGLRHVTSIERVDQLTNDLVMWDAEVRVEHQQGDGHWATLTRIRNVSLVARQPDGWRI